MDNKQRWGRLPMRLEIATRGLGGSLKRRSPHIVDRVLIAQYLLLGDTLMLTPLLAALRHRYPDAQIVMACPSAFLDLYAKRPFGVDPVAFDPRERSGLARLRKKGPYDLAITPANSRYGWLARAAGARWVRAFAGDRLRYRAAIDEVVAWPTAPVALGDLFAHLAQAGPIPRYQRSDWPDPPYDVFEQPTEPYAVLHLGAGSPLRYWAPQKWQEVATFLKKQGLAIILSTGPGQEALAQAVDPGKEYAWFPGTLSLTQLWQVLLRAKLLIVPDTGILHMAKLTQTPTVGLFGPGAANLFGPGEYFADMRYKAITTTISCRNESTLFGQQVDWLKTCQRLPEQCSFQARCSAQIEAKDVICAAQSLLSPHLPNL